MSYPNAPSKVAICLVAGCGKANKAAGYCGQHYQRLRNHADPNYPVKPRSRYLFGGESLTLAEWSRRLDVTIPTLSYRLAHWSVEAALSKPIARKRT